jgi:hypothetical protein
MAILGAVYAAVVLAIAFEPFWAHAGAPPVRTEQTRETWFYPTSGGYASGGYEKLGLRATFSSIQQGSKVLYEAPSSCTVSLVIHRKDHEPLTMDVTLPGLRAEYRIPSTNSWPATEILDQDSLLQWFRNGVGLGINASNLTKQASEVYGLLRQYQKAAPHTGDEFFGVAKADLSDFSWGGFTENANFSALGIGGASFLESYFWICAAATLAYLASLLWAVRRCFGAAWAEIAAGRWTPPRLPAPLPAAIKVLFSLLFLFLDCAVLAGLQSQKGPQYISLGTYVGLGIITIVALQRHSRQWIQQARERGLWPQLGELPTLEQVRGLAQAGEKILAIKLYRQMHGASLTDAKAAVEKLSRTLDNEARIL